jgi:hypothetical protein
MAIQKCEKCGLRVLQFASLSEVRRACMGNVPLCACPEVHPEPVRQIIVRYNEIKGRK